eukprot:g44339.t1
MPYKNVSWENKTVSNEAMHLTHLDEMPLRTINSRPPTLLHDLRGPSAATSSHEGCSQVVVFTKEKEMDDDKFREGYVDTLGHVDIENEEVLEVLGVLKNIKVDKSLCADGIYPTILKEAREDLCILFSHRQGVGTFSPLSFDRTMRQSVSLLHMAGRGSRMGEVDTKHWTYYGRVISIRLIH